MFLDRFHRLRTKLIVLFILVSAGPILLNAGLYLFLAAEATNAAVKRRAHEALNVLVREIDGRMTETFQGVRMVCVERPSEGGAATPCDPGALAKRLEEFLVWHGNSVDRVFILRSGAPVQVLRPVPGPSPGHPPEAREDVEQMAFVAGLSEARPGEVLRTPPYLRPGGWHLALGVRLPQCPETSVVVEMPISRVLGDLCSRAPFVEDVVYFIVGPAEDILYHPDSAYVGQKASAIIGALPDENSAEPVYSSYLGATRRAFSQAIPSVGWRAVIVTVRVVVLKSHRIYLWAAFALTLAVGLMGALLAARMARRLGTSLDRIETGVQEFASGNLDAEIDLRTGDELDRLAHSFNSMARQIKAKNEEIARSCSERAESERLASIGKFTSIIAHELKNPLGSIKVSAGVLRDLARDEQARRMASNISNEVERMNSTLLRVLGYARPTAPRMIPCAIGDVVAKSVSMFEKRFEGSSVRLVHRRCDPPRKIRLDPDQIHQVLTNLLINALEAVAKSPDAEVVVSSGTITGGGPEVSGMTPCVTVSDSGPGIPEELLPRVFEPFVSSKPGGSGLGLAICAQIMSAHGGEIRVRRGEPGSELALYFPESSLEVDQ
ncbi:MAG: HAMP domain-containing sensor histidine kinase [Acidobacteriota bacterium]